MRNFIIKLIACFIFSKRKRREFRNKYMKVDPIWIVRDELKRYINKRIVEVANTMLDTRTLPPAKGNLRKVQEANNVLLKKLGQILKENNINYWLDYGTLLGAYRSKGFVPWDDDIDIGMMRPDFEKLKEVISKQDTFELVESVHFRGNNNFITNKFCLKDKDFDCHFVVDIFLYEFVDCDDMDVYYDKYILDKEILHKEIKATNLLYDYKALKNIKEKNLINSIFDKYRNLYKSKEDGNIILYGIENTFARAKRIYRKETIFPLKEIEFEGEKYLAPNNTEKYLSVNYGDFMKLPNDFGHPKHFNYTCEQIEEMTELANNL